MNTCGTRSLCKFDLGFWLLVCVCHSLLSSTGASAVSKAWRHAGRREVWPLAVAQPETGPFDLEEDEDFSISPPAVISRRERQLGVFKRTVYEVSRKKPVYILFPLPKEAGIKEHNPFGITIDLAKPVVDEAVDEVYRRQLVPGGSLEIAFEDTKLSDAHGPNVAIHALVKNKLDCIIGYAFVYSLAPVARMSPHWEDADSHGIPVITSVGLTANLDNRQEYQLMTRISSPYKVVKDAVIALWREFGWSRSVYIFHDRRHGMTNTQKSLPYGECYLMMASLEPYLSKFHRMEHNYFMFSELHYTRESMKEHLKKASFFSNVVLAASRIHLLAKGFTDGLTNADSLLRSWLQQFDRTPVLIFGEVHLAGSTLDSRFTDADFNSSPDLEQARDANSN